MDVHSVVDSFSSLTKYGSWYTIPFVWVEFISEVAVDNKLLVIFLDQNRQKIAAFVLEHLMDFYNNMDLVANVFVLSHFQIENLKYQKYPTYEKYILLCGEFKIVIGEYTKFIPFESPFLRGFCLYPLVPSIQLLKHDRRHQKLITDVVGRIVMGKRKKGRYHFVLVLHDATGHIIRMLLYDSKQTNMFRTYLAITRNSIVYASRVKLVHLPEENILISTDLTMIAYEPNMPEARDIERIGRS